ncbi:DUF3299 domain-containing protein [Vibrio gallicus]|uniref:DUF3299 domain-containing protein n=1 Tax=Vibrio gallicus TaxID=190897 RepID=UPI0021C3DD5A|nr:DUF3299 domain-containing protein [Vibrio gallicus]
MFFSKSTLLGLLSVVASVSLFAAEAQTTYWDQLTPKMETVEDPFKSLDDNQMFDMATIARFQEAQKQQDFQVSEAAKQEVEKIRQGLQAQGIDVEHLFSVRNKIMQQRQALASLPNKDVLNAKRKIPGFITPIEMKGTKVTKFFLVPTAGACIHTPPPPANQLVLIEYPEGIELISLTTPVWVQGELTGQQSTQDVDYSDGSANVESVYAMTADSIELYSPE